jgi:hypothetical protein
MKITRIVTAKAKAASEKTSIRVMFSPRSLNPPRLGTDEIQLQMDARKLLMGNGKAVLIVDTLGMLPMFVP